MSKMLTRQNAPWALVFLAGLPSCDLVLGLNRYTECSRNCGGDMPTGASTSATQASASSTGASSSTGLVDLCAPTLTDPPKDDTCGVFVDPVNGKDGNPGTMAKPKLKLGAAVGAVTAGKAVFVCDGSLTDTAGVTVPAGVILYGGLDCSAGFKVKADSARTTLSPGAGTIPLTLASGAGKTEVHRFAVNAQAAATPGSSAVGVVIGVVEADLESVDIVSGDGVLGLSSVTPTDNIGPTSDLDPNIAGKPGMPAGGVAAKGGLATTNPMCSTTGGKGGDGGIGFGTGSLPPGDGQAGTATPLPTIGIYDGAPGLADTGAGCTDGNAGHKGDKVADGDGSHGPTSLGTIDVHGYHGVSGAGGSDGKPGQGGGGGGGEPGSSAAYHGASGGGGGAGGCGGKGAPGGGAGGSSIGIIALGLAPICVNVSVQVGNGGDGGTGALGEYGAVGGLGGTPGNGVNGSPSGCYGGYGGHGSDGGSSGGGHGGHSVGIAYANDAPTSGVTVTTGMAGKAGATVGTGAAADPGVASASQKFATQ